MLKISFENRIGIAVFFLAIWMVTGCEKESSDPVSAASLEEFETRIDHLRQEANIPGMAAGIIKDGQITWSKNFGYQDVAQQEVVTDTTIFHLASLTKTFASTVIMQLVGEGKIDLNDPVSDYGINLNENGIVRVIHLLTHTSQGVPGSQFLYNGDRYALLSNVIDSATHKPFHQWVKERINQPLGLQSTAPSDMRLAAEIGFDTVRLKQNTAQGYNTDGKLKVNYPGNFSTAAGLTSDITEMLTFASSFDGNLLLTEEQKEKVFSPMISNDGKILPYGLGWFIQKRENIELNWHYGYWIGMSTLLIRVPEQKLSFVLLANSDKLSSPYPLAKGDIWVSPYAKEFLKSFVLEGAKLK